MLYTQEQLNAMTVDQLKAAIMQGQSVEQEQATEPEQVTPAEQAQQDAAQNLTPLQRDLAKIITTIAQLKEQGAELYADIIKILESKAQALEQQIEAEATKVEETVKEDVQEVATELKIAEQNFIEQYGKYIAYAAGFAIILGSVRGWF